MTELRSLSRQRRARIWVQELPELTLRDGTEILCSRIPASTEANTAFAAAAIELFVPRGPRAEYGLLGGTFEPNREGTLVIRVLTSSATGQIWSPALVSQVEPGLIGLSKQLGQAVLNSAESALMSSRGLPSGQLALDHTVAGAVSSNASLFREMSSILSLYLVSADPKSETLWKAIEES
jgi:hypothetical protein